MRGTLRFGCFPTLAAWAVPALVEHFATKYPDVDVELIEGDAPHLQQLLREGRIDLALLFSAHVREGVEQHPVRDVRPRLPLAGGHRLANRQVLSLAEMAGEPMAMLNVAPVAEILTGVVGQHGLGDTVRWRSTNVDVVRNLVGRGLAWTILIGVGWTATSWEGRPLVAVNIREDLPVNAVVACTAPGSALSPKLQETITVLRSL